MITVADKIHVSDPCYDELYLGTTLDAREGRWVANVTHIQDSWGIYVAVLEVRHVDFLNRPLDFERNSILGVDSGQMSVFPFEAYPKMDAYTPEWDEWYKKVCKATLDTPDYWGYAQNGVVSSTGYGDGGYELEVAYSNGKAIAVRIQFIEDDGEF